MSTSMRLLITGCSGGGKSTLLSALAKDGYCCVPEPGRRVIAAALEAGSATRPDTDPIGFAKAALAMATADQVAVGMEPGPVFFDRGVLDAAVALHHLTGRPLDHACPYDDPIILAPPWPEIYTSDAMRKHGFDAAKAEYDRIVAALATMDRRTITLPRSPVADRIAFLRAFL